MTETINPTTAGGIDAMPVTGTSLDSLNLQLVRDHLRAAMDANRYTGPTDPVTYLRQHNCLIDVAGTTLVTLTGLLCFGVNPQQFFSNAVVDLGHYGSTKPVSVDALTIRKNIGGTIFAQIQQVLSFLAERMKTRSVLAIESIERLDIAEYPPVVLRELCLNMICHRDYVHDLAASRVLLLSNRIEWVSPGGLQPGISIEKILISQKSRNPNIMAICYEAGLVESFGQGLDTVVEVLDREGMKPPQFVDTGHSFIVTIYGRDMTSADVMSSMAITQRLILDALATHGTISGSSFRKMFPTQSQRTIQRHLTHLVDTKQIARHGAGPASAYTLVENADVM